MAVCACGRYRFTNNYDQPFIQNGIVHRPIGCTPLDKWRIEGLEEHLKEIKDDLQKIEKEISEEILKNPYKPNVGKKGCLARISNIIGKIRI